MRDKNKVTKRQGWTDYMEDGMTRVRNERRELERERKRESARSQAPLACESGRVAAYLPVQEQEEEEEGALGDVVL